VGVFRKIADRADFILILVILSIVTLSGVEVGVEGEAEGLHPLSADRQAHACKTSLRGAFSATKQSHTLITCYFSRLRIFASCLPTDRAKK
jgi:hypothetical protein